MYRIFCESYNYFLKMFDNSESSRLNISKPFELLVNTNKYKIEKNKNSILYKKLCDLIEYMHENINRFPRFKAFLWTLESRNIAGKKYNVSTPDELEEQAKLANSFLKLAYWR